MELLASQGLEMVQAMENPPPLALALRRCIIFILSPGFEHEGMSVDNCRLLQFCLDCVIELLL